MSQLIEKINNLYIHAARAVADGSGNVISSTYRKVSDSYTKDEVNNLIGQATGPAISMEVVSVLPETGEEKKIYLVGPKGEGEDKYEEYIWSNSAWVKIGDTSVDLSGYAKKTDLPTITLDSNDKYIKEINGKPIMAERDANGNSIVDTYETKAHASSTYETKANASATYATKTDVENTYAKKTELPTIGGDFYITSINSKSIAAMYDDEGKVIKNTYAKSADVANTYETKANASATYATKSELPTFSYITVE